MSEPTPSMNEAAPVAPRSRQGGGAVRVGVQLLLTVVLTWVIVSRVGVTMEEALSPAAVAPEVRWGWLVASVLLLLMAFGFTARLWGWMVADLGGRDPGTAASLRIVLTANLGRYLPGKVWQMAGLAILSRRSGVPGSLGAAAGVLGQVFHLAGAAVVGMAAFGPDLGWGGSEWIALGVLGLLVLLASIPVVLRGGFRLSFRFARLDTVPVPTPGPGFGPKWVVLHTAAWAVYGLAFAVLVRGLGIDAPPATLAAAFSAAYLLGYVAVFAPAGIGVREGVLIALIRPTTGAGAVGIAVLARVWMTLAELVPAAGFAAWEIFRARSTPVPEKGRPVDG